ncbi:hypothetical protein SDC9_76369 [bioreactor metagenome]|uniref:Uncharacterized protein n=1 Tax=bioreactor metagenome TaxID=1076179 RepID=A0A644YPB5_9ZZZZ
MSRDTRYSYREQKNPAKKPIHPVWRGIGCALLIIIPVISYVAADYFVTNAALFKWVIIPEDMVIKYPADPLILVRLLYMAIFVFILYLILTVITFVVNRYLGPSRYGPYDVPLDQVERRK